MSNIYYQQVVNGTGFETYWGLPMPFITNKGPRAAVQELNVWCLSATGNPVVKCNAIHNCSAAKKASDEDADWLWLRYFLQSAKVMLTWNLQTSKGVTSAYPKLLIFLIKIYLGLVNGCQGVVKKICLQLDI